MSGVVFETTTSEENEKRLTRRSVLGALLTFIYAIMGLVEAETSRKKLASLKDEEPGGCLHGRRRERGDGDARLGFPSVCFVGAGRGDVISTGVPSCKSLDLTRRTDIVGIRHSLLAASNGESRVAPASSVISNPSFYS